MGIPNTWMTQHNKQYGSTLCFPSGTEPDLGLKRCPLVRGPTTVKFRAAYVDWKKTLPKNMAKILDFE